MFGYTSFRVRRDANNELNLEQKQGLFDPDTDNPGTDFVPVLESVEDFQIAYPNVIRDGKVWHIWYEAYDHNYKNDADGYLCYARSENGVKWEKPSLGLVEYGGNRDNNIVIAGPPIRGTRPSNWGRPPSEAPRRRSGRC